MKIINDIKTRIDRCQSCKREFEDNERGYYTDKYVCKACADKNPKAKKVVKRPVIQDEAPIEPIEKPKKKKKKSSQEIF